MKNVFLLLVIMLALFCTTCEKDEPDKDQADYDTVLSSFIIGKWQRDYSSGVVLSEFLDTSYVRNFVTDGDTIPFNPVKYTVDDVKHWLKLHHNPPQNYVVEWGKSFMIWSNPEEDIYEIWSRRTE